jgi:putative phage-type endonuclease
MRRKYKNQQDIRIKTHYNKKRKNNKMSNNQIDILQELLKLPHIKQRTPEWFKLRENRLTASDLYDAIKNPLSLAKRKIKSTTFNSSAILALKWGTMFEAMATRIYSNLKNKKIHEFGLIINEKIDNFGASPDGITEDGVMIEIKCPYSRKIKEKEIPEKYYYQMQGQLAVCNLTNCDYIECEFVCFNNEAEYLENIKDLDNNYMHGIIAEKKENNEFTYHYSSDHQDYQSNINEMSEYVNNGYKLNYWKLKSINIQEVIFDKTNWDNVIINKIKEFNTIYMQEKHYANPLNMFINEEEN